MGIDKRRSSRKTASLEILVSYKNQQIKGQLKDISEHGISCLMAKEIPLFKATDIKIQSKSDWVQLSAISIRKEISAKKKEFLFGFDFNAKQELDLLGISA